MARLLSAALEADLAADGDASPELMRMMAQARAASDLLKAMSHEHRLVLLCLLAEGERSVTELEGLLAMRQPAVSQQLARLRLDRLVTTRREGKQIYYQLASDEVRRMIEAVYDIFCRDGGGCPPEAGPKS